MITLDVNQVVALLETAEALCMQARRALQNADSGTAMDNIKAADGQLRDALRKVESHAFNRWKTEEEDRG